MSFSPQDIRAAVAAHGRVARVSITATKGSVPREVGTSMLVWAAGQSGTIGGGTLEFEAAARALSTQGLQQIPLGPGLGQCCGGHVTLLTEHFDENSEFECSDVTANNQIWIYGAGHVGRALTDVLSPLPDVEISWVDTGIERFPTHDRANVTKIPTAQFVNATKLAPSNAQHFIMTYSHEMDLELCHAILSRDFLSCGLIGSKTKWSRFKSRLTTLGHNSQKINRIDCPIGDPELGKHPQQIAISVASSLLSLGALQALGKDRAL